MLYTVEEVLDYVKEEDVKFVRLAFCDVFGTPKNISIPADELEGAFRGGISFDASAIAGFGDVDHSDLFLFPDPTTLSVLPWRPSHGRVVRMQKKIVALLLTFALLGAGPASLGTTAEAKRRSFFACEVKGKDMAIFFWK